MIVFVSIINLEICGHGETEQKIPIPILPTLRKLKDEFDLSQNVSENRPNFDSHPCL